MNIYLIVTNLFTGFLEVHHLQFQFHIVWSQLPWPITCLTLFFMENLELLWILGREEGEGYEGKVIFGERSKRKTLYLGRKNEEWVICEGKSWMERLLNTRKDYVNK